MHVRQAGTHIRLGRTQLELDETNLRLLYPYRATDGVDHVLVEDNTVDQLSVFNSSSNLLDDADVPEINIGGRRGG